MVARTGAPLSSRKNYRVLRPKITLGPKNFRSARILVGIHPLFLPLERLNSIFFRQNPFKLSEVSDSSKIAREPTPFGQKNSHSRDILG